MPVKNVKLIFCVALGALCAVVIAAGIFFFWQQDQSYKIRMDNLYKSQASLGYETLATHQFAPLLDKYKTPYMGDAVNMNSLFQNLLLVRAGVGIAIDADTYTLQVYYQAQESELGTGNVRAALAYNSVAAFTLVDNLQHIEYFFPGNNFLYSINRTDVQDWFGTDDLAGYFPSELEWKEKFQNVLQEDDAYTDHFFTVLFVEKDYRNPDFDGADAQNGSLGNAAAGKMTDKVS